ncbi:MAG: PEP-CTERM sorting domain-containing protein [Armatimonadaceae bacterium]
MKLISATTAAGALLAAQLCLPSVTSAQGTWYTSESSFLAAVTGTLTDTYSDLTDGYYAFGQSRLSGTLGLWANGGLYKGKASGVDTVSTNNPTPLEFTSTGYDSIGGIFNLTDINFNLQTGLATFEIYDGATLVSSTNLLHTTYNSFFMGYVGTTLNSNPILKFTPTTANQYAGVEKTYLATASPSSVPEPGEWAAMGILGAGLTGLVIRKRRSA